MPEAPEVQNVINSLRGELTGHKIIDAQIRYPRLISHMEPEAFIQRIVGQTFHSFERYGKYLIFEMDNADWISHLRMEGKFRVEASLPQGDKAKHVHAVFLLDDQRYLCYFDTRKFGRMELYDKLPCKAEHTVLKRLGKDVMDPTLCAKDLYEALRKRKIPVKSALLDQSVIAGIGNIYADEILFAARLDPRTSCSQLNMADCQTIVEAARSIMSSAMEQGGTTIRSFSFGHGQSGSFQSRLYVHTRQGKECRVCKQTIEKIVVGQRGTYLCPNCQKKK